MRTLAQVYMLLPGVYSIVDGWNVTMVADDDNGATTTLTAAVAMVVVVAQPSDKHRVFPFAYTRACTHCTCMIVVRIEYVECSLLHTQLWTKNDSVCEYRILQSLRMYVRCAMCVACVFK